MSEYIERGAALDKCGWYNTVNGKSVCAARKDELVAIPAADVVGVKHGRWINRRFGSADVICSECRTLETNRDSNYKSRFCPNCGAKMDGKGEGK